MSNLTKIKPINVINLHLIPQFYQHTINDFSIVPILKVGFFGSGENYLEKMFVVEENQFIISFVKNVFLGNKEQSYRRSMYIIVRSKVSYVHFKTGTIFKDIFDYALIEKDEVAEFFEFEYKGTRSLDVESLYYDDNDFKTKTKIFIKSTDIEVENNFYHYIYYLPINPQLQYKEIQNKVGYYIEEDSLSNFHICQHFSKIFSTQDSDQIIKYIYDNAENLDQIISQIVNTNFSSGYINNDNNKIKINNDSLINIIKNEISSQLKSTQIGVFLAEVLFKLFFRF